LVADDLEISLPVGTRLLVVANLRLEEVATESSTLPAGEVGRAVAAWPGPGAVVVAGDLFDLAGWQSLGPDRSGNCR